MTEIPGTNFEIDTSDEALICLTDGEQVLYLLPDEIRPVAIALLEVVLDRRMKEEGLRSD